MVKKLTLAWLEKQSACSCGVEWWKTCGETASMKVLRKLNGMKLLEKGK